MPLIKNGAAIEDRWETLADDTPLPADRPVVVSHARWLAERGALDGRNAPLGLALPNTADSEALNGDVHRFDLIALHFPKFGDGRAYSQARILRERLGFKGELRATGNVLRDQLLAMHRVGFDAFEIERPDAAEAFRSALADLTVFYQPTGDGRPTALRRRLSGAGA